MTTLLIILSVTVIFIVAFLSPRLGTRVQQIARKWQEKLVAAFRNHPAEVTKIIRKITDFPRKATQKGAASGKRKRRKVPF